MIEARALKRLGDPQAALDLLAALVPPERYNAGVLATAGECLGLLGRPGDAASWYEEAALANPDDAELAAEAARWRERADR